MSFFNQIWTDQKQALMNNINVHVIGYPTCFYKLNSSYISYDIKIYSLYNKIKAELAFGYITLPHNE